MVLMKIIITKLNKNIIYNSYKTNVMWWYHSKVMELDVKTMALR